VNVINIRLASFSDVIDQAQKGYWPSTHTPGWSRLQGVYAAQRVILDAVF
jgi:hypothetical protein